MRHDPHFVDQLFKGEEISIGRKIALNLIEANPDQPRSMLGDLGDLKASIEARESSSRFSFVPGTTGASRSFRESGASARPSRLAFPRFPASCST